MYLRAYVRSNEGVDVCKCRVFKRETAYASVLPIITMDFWVEYYAFSLLVYLGCN